jgi:DNA-binding beta-propeller fold protein YncE
MPPPPLLLLLLALLPVLRCAVLLPCDTASLAVTTVAGCGGACTAFQGATPLASSLTTPSGLSASPAGTLYIADSGAHTVRALNLTSGAWVGGGWNVTSARAAGYAEGALAGAARFRAPLDVAYSPCTGVVYVADSENHVLRVLTPVNATTVLSSLLVGNPGAPGSLAGVGTGANFNKPLGLALSPSCALLYVSDGGNAIKVVHLGTRNVTTLAGSGNGGSTNGVGTAAQFYEPQKLVLDATGTLLRFGNKVRGGSRAHCSKGQGLQL